MEKYLPTIYKLFLQKLIEATATKVFKNTITHSMF